MKKWYCEKCNWRGDYPAQAHQEYEDGGYPACPNGCVDDRDGEPQGTVLNPNHPENMLMFAKTLRQVWG